MNFADNLRSEMGGKMPFRDNSSPVLEPEIADAYNAWKTNDTNQTRGALLKATKPIIDTAVYSYAGKNASPSIRGQAKLMALDAFGTYNPQSGNMRSHLLSTLRRLQRTTAQANQPIAIPERVIMDRMSLAEAEDQLSAELGREPSDAEIADRTGLSLKRIGYVRNARQAINTGSILDEEGDVYSPPSDIPGSNNKMDAWQEMVYHDLNPTDQAVMEYTLGLRGAPVLSNTELAEKLNITPGAVSQRKAKIQQMLDDRFGQNLFGGE